MRSFWVPEWEQPGPHRGNPFYQYCLKYIKEARWRRVLFHSIMRLYILDLGKKCIGSEVQISLEYLTHDKPFLLNKNSRKGELLTISF